jgi:hypothetical protein
VYQRLVNRLQQLQSGQPASTGAASPLAAGALHKSICWKLDMLDYKKSIKPGAFEFRVRSLGVIIVRQSRKEPGGAFV